MSLLVRENSEPIFVNFELCQNYLNYPQIFHGVSSFTYDDSRTDRLSHGYNWVAHTFKPSLTHQLLTRICAVSRSFVTKKNCKQC